MKLNPYLQLCCTRLAHVLLRLGLEKIQSSIISSPWASGISRKEQRTSVSHMSVLDLVDLKLASKLSYFLYYYGHSAQSGDVDLV